MSISFNSTRTVLHLNGIVTIYAHKRAPYVLSSVNVTLLGIMLAFSLYSVLLKMNNMEVYNTYVKVVKDFYN